MLLKPIDIYPFILLMATDERNGIAKDGKLPWDMPEELALFKKITIGNNNSGIYNAVIMGRKTYDSLPKIVRPLPQRINIVITRDKTFVSDDVVIYVNSLDEALQICRDAEDINEAYVIGGAEIASEAFKHNDLVGAFISVIPDVYECDKFIEIPDNYRPISTINMAGFSQVILARV